jgi:hypothetical protein
MKKYKCTAIIGQDNRVIVQLQELDKSNKPTGNVVQMTFTNKADAAEYQYDHMYTFTVNKSK